jgi:2-polyprenyl-6-methoxyphenol hydroxylase-like FAD-dependent oxidoreductase
MPAGRAILAELGLLSRFTPDDCHPIASLCYVQEDGSRTTGRLPAPGGLGIRRTALTRILAGAAEEAGVAFLWNCRVRDHAVSATGVELRTSLGKVAADVLVAADGLHSPIRHRAGLAGHPARRRRFGLRRHYRLRPESDQVEIHLAPGVECFVTPVGEERVGVAFLWEKDVGVTESHRVDFAGLLARFPRVAERVAEAAAETQPRGAGPLEQAVRSPVADRVVLLGDAAGYVDAVTGEGMSLAFQSAVVLGACLPDALRRGADRASLRPYTRAHARLYRRYALVTRALLALARRPTWRRRALGWLESRPKRFESLIRWALDA